MRSEVTTGEAYIGDVRIDVGRHDLQAYGCNCDTHDGAHIMRLELEAYALDDDTDGDEYGSWDRGVQAALGIDIAIVGLGMQIDKSVGYRTC